MGVGCPLSALLAHTETHRNVVDRLLDLLGLPLVTEDCGLVGGTPISRSECRAVWVPQSPILISSSRTRNE